jgi:hypothetical protein
MTNTGGIEEKIHTSKVGDELLQPLGSIIGSDVDTSCGGGTKVAKHRLPSGSHTNLPTLTNQQSRHLTPDA